MTNLRCAKCRRPIAAAAATLAGMPLGPVCAKQIAEAVSTTPLEVVTARAAARESRAQEAAFLARQIPLIEGVH